MKTAFLFPGQGSQYVGMGKALAAEFPIGAKFFDEANSALGYDLKKICFAGPEADLTLTKNTQPAILTVSVAVHAVVSAETGLRPDIVAGHSLGEYSALVAAGALRFADAVKAVHLRGKFMQEAVPAGQGAMAALIGGTNEAVIELCKEAAAATGKACEMANFNGGGQVVISGAKAAVEKAIALCEEKKEFGIRRAVLLPVSAPFHCSLMQPAADNLRPVLEKMEIAPLKVPYIANVDAEAYKDAKAIVGNLYAQVSKSVLWEQSMAKLPALGIQAAYEIGPGRVLAGLMRRIVKDLNCTPVEAPDSIRALPK